MDGHNTPLLLYYYYIAEIRSNAGPTNRERGRSLSAEFLYSYYTYHNQTVLPSGSEDDVRKKPILKTTYELVRAFLGVPITGIRNYVI